MDLQDVSVTEFVSSIKNSGKSLVIYGLGVIGKITVPAFLEEYDLSGNVLFIADSDIHKQGMRIVIAGKTIEVCPPQKMKEIAGDFAILITGSRFSGILNMLDQFELPDHVGVYLFPQMLVRKCRSFKKAEIIHSSSVPQIPKMIHYCWFGEKEIPDILRRYMESWSKFCPDYQIIRWSEKNFDLQKYRYTEQAYKNKRWGFIPDIVRLDVLNEYGGIYLDTDVELLKPLDDLLYQPGFCGVEKWGVINIGGGCGAVPGHPMIRKILDYRTQFEFEYPDGTLNLESSGSFETAPLIKEGFRPNNTIQCIDGLTVYSSDFFHPYDYMSQEVCVTENTYSIHHFYGSWV